MVEITPNYVNKFKCLGSECIDTCCQGWMISIDKKTHNKYQGIEIDGVNKINKFLKIWDKPTEDITLQSRWIKVDIVLFRKG